MLKRVPCQERAKSHEADQQNECNRPPDSGRSPHNGKPALPERLTVRQGSTDFLFERQKESGRKRERPEPQLLDDLLVLLEQRLLGQPKKRERANTGNDQAGSYRDGAFGK